MTSEFRAGSDVGGYVLDSYIGGGSFGAVWKGHSANTGQEVAVKLLTGALSSAETAAMRADIELLAGAAAERSQHVVHVIGGGGSPVPHIVMEYVEGSDFATILKDTGKLTAGQTIDVGLAISDALAALNEAGIIHRDIKPANVMMDKDGVIKLTDFGIAKIVGYETMTMTGQAAMTMAYAAPEIWDDGSPFGKPSHKSDLYAMGVLLYQCVLGETPFRGNYGALYKAHLERTPDITILPPETPPSLRTLIARCLEKRQEDRPKDAAECIAMLRRAEAELAEATGDAGTTEPKKLGPWIKDSPHETVPWTWHAHHETKGDKATVEVHFAESLDYGARLRKAVGASSTLAPLGAERIIDSNRLLLHPNEQWHEPPAGRFQFWVAREDREVTAASVVDRRMLQIAVPALVTLLAEGETQGVTLEPDDNLSILSDGSIYLRRPGLAQPHRASGESAIDALLGLPLNAECRALVTSEHTLDTLAAKLSTPEVAPEDATQFIQPDNATVFVAPVPAAVAAAVAMPEPEAPAPRPVQPPPPSFEEPVGAVGLALSVANAGAARSEYELALRNNTNRPMNLRLDAFDDGQDLAYSLTRQVTLPANAAQVIKLRVEPHKPRKFGGKKSTVFTVAASGGGGSSEPPFTIDGQFDEQPPAWPLFAGAGVLGIAVAAVLAATALSGGGGHKQPNLALINGTSTPAASVATVEVPPTATATPEPAPTDVPPPADVPPPPPDTVAAAQPTPVPPPRPTATPVPVSTGGGSTTTTTTTVITPPTWTPVPPPPPPPPPADTPTPVPAGATYTVVGWAASPAGACANGNPACPMPASAVASGGTVKTCNSLYVWTKLHNVKVPVTLTSTWYGPSGSTIASSNYNEIDSEHTFWSGFNQTFTTGRYTHEIKASGQVVSTASINVVC